MAGCLPDHMPIVVASALAMMDPAFDLAEMQGTTHATAPLIIVNGPARAMCGVASGYGALGPGHRANASIGRAIRLAMINIGGARPGTSDMALLGHGGKFGQCLGEDEAHSPFAPLHTSRGFAAEDSAVTVIGTEPPQSVAHVAGSDIERSSERLIELLAASVAGVGSNNAWLGGGQAVIVLTPDHIGNWPLPARSVIDAGAIVDGPRLATVGLRSSRRRHPARGRRWIGLYSYVFPTWCAGANRNRAVTHPIDIGQACAIPER